MQLVHSGDKNSQFESVLKTKNKNEEIIGTLPTYMKSIFLFFV